jgi:hypothetical protein
MRFEGHPDLQRMWDRIEKLENSGVVSRAWQTWQIEVMANQIERACAAGGRQLRAKRELLNESVASMEHRLAALEKALQIEAKTQALLGGALAQQALTGSEPQKLLGSGQAAARVVVTEDRIEEEATKIAMGYPLGDVDAGKEYLLTHWDRLEEEDHFPPEAAKKVIDLATQKVEDDAKAKMGARR